MILLYIYDALLGLLFVAVFVVAFVLARRRNSSIPPPGGSKNAEAEYLTRHNPVNWW